MPKPLSEEQESLNELKKQERQWLIMRWVMLVGGIVLILGSIKFSQDSTVLGPVVLIFTIIRWRGDPKSKLIIKLYEEKLEREFLEEEIEKSRKIAIQEKKIDDFLQKQSQQPE